MIMLKDSVAGEIVQFLHGHCEGQSVQAAFIPVLIASHPTINVLSINPLYTDDHYRCLDTLVWELLQNSKV